MFFVAPTWLVAVRNKVCSGELWTGVGVLQLLLEASLVTDFQGCVTLSLSKKRKMKDYDCLSKWSLLFSWKKLSQELQSMNGLLSTAVRKEKEGCLDVMKQSHSSASHLMSFDSPNTAHTFHLHFHLELLFFKPMCTSHPTTHLLGEELLHESS